MIKNIPNKYTQKMLVDLLNTTHFGRFDFLYLRIDFKNKCNVGYAFINFVDARYLPWRYLTVRAILDFVLHYVGKLWPHFNSEKLCDLAYARVQGKAALIEKFRNSRFVQTLLSDNQASWTKTLPTAQSYTSPMAPALAPKRASHRLVHPKPTNTAGYFTTNI
ncbi:hypothetical protein DSO57_1039234 [Entomophthora muscae]|uniref:Uncharacterized protein n=1 Tax=Entomophthora muscae TaxID=34485 RepID=A0ACC2U7S9_9FUNG|nr:hypothetical protein DSO57_1039234 [Entomophthora muscae]